MPGKTLTPRLVQEAILLRSAGHTLASVSERLGCSVRSLTRIFERHAVSKGSAQAAAISSARSELRDAITSNDRIIDEAARLVADDLAHARILRARMVEAAEHLTATNLVEAALVMRAVAAYSTALKNTADMTRKSLRIDETMAMAPVEGLPVLEVRSLTPAEIADLRAQQQQADTETATSVQAMASS